MPRFDWNYFHEKARPVVGGIKAQTERGGIVKNWWAKRWLTALESFDGLGGRLARGRSYARKGQVISIDIKEGHVSAVVQGSLPKPYNVEIEVRTIPIRDWLDLSSTTFSQPATAAKLLSGEMPEHIDLQFAERNMSLFPSAATNDLKTFCSCPDMGNPCKHIAAVYYLLGEEFDRDPFLIFKLRGMRKEKLLELLIGTTREEEALDAVEESPAADSESDAKPEKGKGKKKRVTAKVKVPPLPVDAEKFWKTPPLMTHDFAGSVHIPTSDAALPKSLGNLPFWRSSQPFAATLEQIYHRASDSAAGIVSAED